jgi:uncharacterized protein (TIGR00297 family)
MGPLTKMQDVELMIAIFFILVISITGWKLKSLTPGGAIGAIVVGLSIYVGYSFQGLLLLGCFFCSSSLLSKVQSAKKSNLLDLLEKGDRRDMIQVMANGGVPAILSIFAAINGIPDQALLVVFCISIAAANADTWASEIGTLSRQKPRLLLTLKKVERGTSGAVSSLGTCAAISGAAFISLAASFLFSLSLAELLYILAFGFIGNLIDTLMGQTIQNKYKCSNCGKITEKQVHCSKRGIKFAKYSFLNNDAVNFLSIAISTILGWIILS